MEVTNMEGVVLLFSGISFYCSSFLITKQTLLRFFKENLSEADVVSISEKIVNSIQGIISTVVGAIISYSCHGDILYSSCWLTNAYTWFGLPYFMYDLVVMYLGHLLTFPEVREKSLLGRLQHFVLYNKALTVHHIVLPLIFFPVIVFFRNGVGDYFIGVFFQIEIVIPFIAARNILVQLQLKDTVLYVFVGLAMIITFFISRILVFPFLYWQYALYRDIPVWRVPTNIPLKCSVGCAIIMSLQIYWMSLMIKGLRKLIYKLAARSSQEKIS